MLGGNANSYATSPILLKISSGPQNLAANFLQFPSLRELFLSYFQIFPDFHPLLFHVLENFRPNNHSVTWIVPTHKRFTPSSIQSLKWTRLQGSMISVVVRKFHQVKVALPLGWLIHHIHPQHILNHLIISLRLSISLWMICGIEVQNCSKLFEQSLPKIGSELGISV